MPARAIAIPADYEPHQPKLLEVPSPFSATGVEIIIMVCVTFGMLFGGLHAWHNITQGVCYA